MRTTAVWKVCLGPLRNVLQPSSRRKKESLLQPGRHVDGRPLEARFAGHSGQLGRPHNKSVRNELQVWTQNKIATFSRSRQNHTGRSFSLFKIMEIKYDKTLDRSIIEDVAIILIRLTGRLFLREVTFPGQ